MLHTTVLQKDLYRKTIQSIRENKCLGQREQGKRALVRVLTVYRKKDCLKSILGFLGQEDSSSYAKHTHARLSILMTWVVKLNTFFNSQLGFSRQLILS